MRHTQYILFALLLTAVGEQVAWAQSYFVQWSNLTGVAVNGNTIQKTDVGGWNAGAFSTNIIPAGTDGWLEFKAPFDNVGTYKLIGLSDQDVDVNYTTIDHGFYLQSSLYVYENGTNKINLGAFSPGEILRIERVGTSILYKRNGNVVYTSAVTSTNALSADLSLNGVNASFDNVVISHPVTGQQPADISYDIAWTDLVGVSSDDISITKNVAGGWGTSGAASINKLNANTDGWVEVPVLSGQTNGSLMIGFSDTNDDASYNTIDYALFISNSTQGVKVYENGSDKGVTATYVVGDKFKVERVGTSILYKKNGTTFYTSTVPSSSSLIVDAAINTLNYKIEGAKASFWIPFQQGLVPDEWEFKALKDVYDSLGGPSWTTKTNWPVAGSWPATATAAQYATWYRVVVSYGDVTQLNLYNNNLIGKIPSSIQKLSRLIYLQLYSNKIAGPLTPAIGNLSRLTLLSLYTNLITGEIPDEIGNLNRLTTLYLYANKFSGAIPSSLNSLSSLVILNISQNLFTGGITDLSGITSLQELYLHTNAGFTPGPIPAWIRNLSSLRILNVAGTVRTGTIPPFLGEMNNLTALHLYTNQLTGSIPNVLGNLTALTALNLSANQLSGSIPESIGNLTNLTTLSLNNNQLTGPIPASIGNLTKLLSLYIYTNKLSGSIPASIGNLNKVNTLYAYTNQLSGELPGTIGNMTDLQYFRVDANQLTGNIPSSFSGLTKMKLFYVNANRLSGPIPPVMGTWPLLYAFTISGNKFTSVPTDILNNPLLTTVTLYDNELTSIPDFSTYSNKANLVLDIRNNRLDYTKIEPLIGAGIKTLSYNTQKPINDVTAISMTSSLTIPSRPATPNTTIIWEKQNGASWTNIDASNQDATKQTFYIASATASNEGMYRWRMTNTVVTGLSLASDPIAVSTAQEFALNNWAFQYKYDSRKRMTHKKVPGADWVYMVYDNRDRLVMTQDGEQRKTNKWSFTKYDALNRPVMTGIYTHTTAVDQATMSGLISTANFNETYDGTTTFHGYTHVVWPTDMTKMDVMTVTYFDNYNFMSTWADEYKYKSGELPSRIVNGITYSQPATEFNTLTGQVTGRKVKMIGSYPYWIQTANYYDDHYRIVQTVSDHFDASLERITNVYDFAGRVISSKTTLENNNLTWRNQSKFNKQGEAIFKTAGVSSWDGGASTMQQLPSNVDGWAEVTVGDGTVKAWGLSDDDTDLNPSSIDYNFLVQYTTLYIQENGVNKLTSATAQGDKLRISRVGGIVKYFKNGVLLYTSSVTSTSNLVLDVSLYTGGSAFSNFTGSFLRTDKKSITRTYDYDHTGRLVNANHGVNGQVPWSNLTNVTDFGNKIGKTSGGVNVWDGIATTEPIFAPGQDGWIDARVDTYSQSFYGFETLDETNSVVNSYQIRVSSMGAQVIIYKDGNAVTYNGGVINAGDRIRVERKGNLILCKINNQATYTFSNVDNNRSLRVSAKFLHANSHFLYDTKFGFPEILLAHNEYNELGQLIDKKLHSEDAGATYKQSVDYRYNIRGWLTSMNNADLNSNPTTNDDTGDLFGMELAYDTEIDPYSTAVYNGNISGIKWSANQGLGDVKTNAYFYEYDGLSRITHAAFRQNIAGNWTNPTNAFTETGYDYDLNGNIKKLDRYGKGGAQMDILTYDYGAGDQQGNQLRWVADAGDKTLGFVDGNVSGDDYLYDANGNMTSDKNKNITAITYNYLNLPEKVTKGTGEYIKYIYDAGGRKLSQQVYASNNTLTKSTDYVGEYIYENDTLRFINTEEGRVILPLSSGEGAGGEVEYQYHLKDHLGNVRVTFTTKDEQEDNLATLETENETEERTQFLYYDDVRLVNSTLFDHTGTGATHNALRLNGSANENTGLGKSLAVVPGDKIQLEVYAKYVDPESSNLTTALANLLNAIAAGTAAPGTVIDGAGYASGGSNAFPFGGLLDKSNDTGTGPKAYLNYLVFNKDFIPQMAKSGFKRLGPGAKEDGALAETNGGEGVPHEKLDWEIDITEPGYVYIWLSNEEVELGGDPVEVYFDDFKVTHVKSPVISSSEYYPFGLSFGEYQRENSILNQYKYNGKELQDELSINWYDYGARMYMPDIGRWNAIDPLAEQYLRWAPYNYAINDPIRIIDPDGMRVRVINEKDQNIVKTSVSEAESNFVKFNENGEVDKKALREGRKELGRKNLSENFKNLRSLVRSETEYVVGVSDENGDFDKNTLGEISEIWGPLEDGKPLGENGLTWTGTSLLGLTTDSGDGKVEIKIHGGQSDEDQAITFSHEAYGHAFFHSKNRSEEYWQHQRDENGADSNKKLADHINNAEKLTKQFIKQRNKK